MKKILKLALVALVGVIGYNANAQESGFLVKAGLNLNNIKDNDGTGDNNVGFHLGAGYEYAFTENFAIEPGVYLDTRGAKAKEGEITAKINMIGVTIPVLAKGKFAVGNDFSLFANVGPYVNLNFSGKMKAEGYGESVSQDIKFGSNAGEMKTANFGLNFGGGVEFKKFILGLGYDLGLSNVSNVEGNKAKLHALKISVGYKF